ncbi:LPXTG cell wall anchor domain-containing protein [Rossellomorea vietnamensis]|uniref:LPXTG cell wall anchor domain-containing protein n=1 Tax=Rossellomorea vietnamensis TaxID=218284 RepID=A0A5D4KGI3_9BACI|nr:LPXTG cell wall anchor domain-containing protein [Rossellomorea vietnamensis]TYR75989.1 LPXTG cell wall anchor domain-containing protein [Rossellomorea vietnamensis]
MKNKSKIVPITLSTSLVMFSFGAMPAGAAYNGDAAKEKIEEAVDQVLENEQAEETASDSASQEESQGGETEEAPVESSPEEEEAAVEETAPESSESEEASSETEENGTEEEQAESENEAELDEETSVEENPADETGTNEETESTKPETVDLDTNFSFIKALFKGQIEAMALVKSDGTTINLEYKAGYWCNFDYTELPAINGIEITVEGVTHTLLFSDYLEEVKAYIYSWMDSNVSFEDNTSNLLTDINVDLQADFEVDAAKLKLSDGSFVELDPHSNFEILGETAVEAESVVALWLVIGGKEYLIDLNGEQAVNGVLEIVVDEEALGIMSNVVTKIDLSIPDGLDLQGLKLILVDGSEVELESHEELYVLLSEGNIEVEHLKSLWLLINGKECTIDLEDTTLLNGVLTINIDEDDLEFHKVTDLTLTLPEEIEIEEAKLVLEDETTIDLDISEGLSFVLEDIYLSDISALWLKVDGEVFTVDITEGDEVEGVLEFNLGMDIFFDTVTELDLNLPEGLDVEEAKLVLADGTHVDLDLTKGWAFLFEDKEFYLQNVSALWLMIDGKKCLINLEDWNYELTDEGYLSVTITEELIDLNETPEEETDIEFLTWININLLGFTGTIDSAFLVCGDHERLELEIVDGMLILDLEDLELTMEELLHLEIVIDGETYTIEFDEEELSIVDGEVTIDTDIEVVTDKDVDTDTDTDKDTDTDVDTDVDVDTDTDTDTDTDVDADTDTDTDTDETLTGNTDSDDTTKKSGVLPYTGENSNMLFYLIGLFITSLGVFSLKKKKLTEE